MPRYSEVTVSIEAILPAARDVYAFRGGLDEIRSAPARAEMKTAIILAAVISGNPYLSISVALGYGSNKAVMQVAKQLRGGGTIPAPLDDIVEEILEQAKVRQILIDRDESADPPEVAQMRKQVARGDKLLGGLISSDRSRESLGGSVA